MTIFGGIAPGTFQAWELNLPEGALIQQGIARGLRVTQNNPIGMSVVVGVDVSTGDGIAFMPSGAWIDTNAAITLNIANNGGASPRTDAVVATSYQNVSTSPSIVYTQNWTGGLSGGTSDQLALALVTVPVSSSGITNANIQQQSLIAQPYQSLFSQTTGNITSGAVWWTQTSSIGFEVQDNATANKLDFSVIAPLGTGRGFRFNVSTASTTFSTVMTMDQSANINFNTLPRLSSGIQDHGHCGIGPAVTANGQLYGQGVQFHATLVNVPTSVSLTITAINNATLNVTRITQYGFDLELSCTGAGAYGYADYVTVGN